jgi:hypothetical protein
MSAETYMGMWVTADGHVRQELLSDGRHDEARGATRSAYHGEAYPTGWVRSSATSASASARADDGVAVGNQGRCHGPTQTAARTGNEDRPPVPCMWGSSSLRLGNTRSMPHSALFGGPANASAHAANSSADRGSDMAGLTSSAIG